MSRASKERDRKERAQLYQLSKMTGVEPGENTYVRQIQPRLAAVTISALASALVVSAPYAADIRAGRHRPHPRHWQALAQIVGIFEQGETNREGITKTS
jgi:hypothetical protein